MSENDLGHEDRLLIFKTKRLERFR
jgi:hypothetical protein